MRIQLHSSQCTEEVSALLVEEILYKGWLRWQKDSVGRQFIGELGRFVQASPGHTVCMRDSQLEMAVMLCL